MLDRPKSRNLQSSKEPSSRIGRLFHYGGAHICMRLAKSSADRAVFFPLRSRGVTRLRCGVRAHPSDNASRGRPCRAIADVDRRKCQASRLQIDPDAWRSVEARSIHEHTRSVARIYAGSPSNLIAMCVQDSHVLPPEIEDVFRRVQDSAHYMPDWQMEVRRFLFP